ncbi:uncharacterized protein V1516DRAFT_674544 [Lipomyces oligophaga]|uniref:uncharacterized protein n=1 Tax=Lipomyces oligophaga TaxID=45792 RepID=UPI0034CD2F0C
MSLLTRLPHEVLYDVLASVSLRDALSVGSTCKELRSIVLDSDVFWNFLLHKTFDTVLVSSADVDSSIPTTASAHLDPSADISAQHRLLSIGAENNIALIRNVHSENPTSSTSLSTSYNYLTGSSDSTGGAASSDKRLYSQASSAAAASATISQRRQTQSRSRPRSGTRIPAAKREFKQRFRYFLQNSRAIREKYADEKSRLGIREDVVSCALHLLRENDVHNFTILLQSQLFSAVVFDQFIPGTMPVKQLGRLPSPSAFTLKPNALILQQRLDMLRVIFGQRVPRAPIPYNLRELQAIVYDSMRFSLFSENLTVSRTAVLGSSSGTSSMYRPLGPKRLPDSIWGGGMEHLCDQTVVPRFDVLIAILAFFGHHATWTQLVRDGLGPFFNNPPEASDFDYKDTDLFEFPNSWKGLYSYLPFWNFAVLRQASGAAAAAAAGASASGPTSTGQSALATGGSGSNDSADPRFSTATAAHPSFKSVKSKSRPTLPETASTASSGGALPPSSASSARKPKTAAAPPPVTASWTSYPIDDQFDGMQAFEADLPAIHGPVSFVGYGHDRLLYRTYSTLVPLNPCFGLPGFARFAMRKEYIQDPDSDSDDYDDNHRTGKIRYDGDLTVWEYNGVYIPGPKILLGRWRDGSDPSMTHAVEGPFMFYAEL